MGATRASHLYFHLGVVFSKPNVPFEAGSSMVFRQVITDIEELHDLSRPRLSGASLKRAYLATFDLVVSLLDSTNTAVSARTQKNGGISVLFSDVIDSLMKSRRDERRN